MFTIGAFAIIFNAQGQVLLSHRRDVDMWNLPDRGMESRELPTEAVIREVMEETGLEVTVERMVGVYGKVDKDDLVFAFVCKVVGGELRLSDEADEHRYFDVNALPPNTLQKQVERIFDAVRDLPAPVFRRQNMPSRAVIG